MRIKNLLAFIAAFACCLFCVSCSDDDKETLSLVDIEHNSIDLYYPAHDAYATSIIGGDGNYTISNNNEAGLEAKLMDGQTLSLTALSTGEAVVTIKDQSNHTYVLNVHIYYRSNELTIGKLNVKIEGENLTEKEVAEIREKALATVPVKVNGGYKFVYTDESGYSGKLFVYPETVGQNGKEGTFKIEEKFLEGDVTYSVYELNFDGQTRVFILNRYDDSFRSSPPQQYAFIEDLLERFKSDYPNLTKIYTQQAFKY